MPSETMLDRLRRRSTIANEHFAGCRRVEAHVDGDIEWTIGHDAERVLLALEDAKPVRLTTDEAIELANALALRAAKVRQGVPDSAA